MKKNPSTSGQNKPATKQSYRKPRVTAYGDLRTITQKAGNRGDGGGKPATRK